MLIRYDPDEHETVFHQKHPVAKIKADRLRKEEDEILARAEIIKAKRASTDTMLGEADVGR